LPRLGTTGFLLMSLK